MNMKKTLVLLLTLALTVGMLAGCGGKKDNPKEPVDVQPEVVLDLSELKEQMTVANGLYEEVLVKVQEAQQYENDLKAAQEATQTSEEQVSTEQATEEKAEETATGTEETTEVTSTEVEETEKSRLAEVVVELGDIRAELDAINSKIEAEDFDTEEEVDVAKVNVETAIGKLTVLKEEFGGTEVAGTELADGNKLTVVNKQDKDVKSITLALDGAEYGSNVLTEEGGLTKDGETSVLVEEGKTLSIKVITADDAETELTGVEITKDTKVEIVLDGGTNKVAVKIVE